MPEHVTGMILREDGTREVVQVRHDFREFQKVIGGDFECVRLRLGLGWPATGYIREDGKIAGLPANVNATNLAELFIGDRICGPMLVVGPADQYGMDTSLTQEQIEWLTNFGQMG